MSKLEQQANLFIKRPYQKQAIKSLIGFVSDMVFDRLENRGQKYENASLLEMATGSGKTFTVGKYLDLLFRLRNRKNREAERLGKQKEFEGLNILVLTNRIDGLNQFRDDLVHGRQAENKSPIISSKVLDNIEVSTFHSKADNLENIDISLFTQNEEDETETFSKQNGRKKDNIFFSTYQTASLKVIESKIPYFDIVIIDETHNVRGGNEFEELIDKLSTHGRDGKSPLILPLTATPTNKTEELFGEPVFSYPLAEYLASEYSPDVEYKLIASSITSKEEIEVITSMIDDAKQIKDYKEKKQLLKEINERFEQIMLKLPSLQDLVSDLLDRLIVNDNKIKETIIFASSINQANVIVKEINKRYGEDISVAYHSDTDKKGLDRLKDKNNLTKIVVSVDMLNESVDLPVVSNVVFWRGTDVARIYLQQFGRGLRGRGLVRYYDYVGGMQNFAWVGGIYEKYKEINGNKGNDNGLDGLDLLDGGEKTEKFRLLGGSLGASEYGIDLSTIGFDILSIEKSLELKTLENYKEYFKGNSEEFVKFGILIDKEKNEIYLNNIESHQKFNLFGILAESGLKNLSIAMGNKEISKITNKQKAQEILKQFFEDMGYEVILDIQEKVRLVKLEDYKEYFKGNGEKFEKFGILRDKEKNEIDLNNIKNPNKFNLFGIKAGSGLKNLSEAMGNKEISKITNKQKVQEILKQFFEDMGYKVVGTQERLEVLKDYEYYFHSHIKEFKDFGILIDEENNKIDLNNIESFKKFYLFGIKAEYGLKNLNTAMGNKELLRITNKQQVQEILKQFFEDIGYKVVVDIQEKVELENLDDYKKYFKGNNEEFVKFGVGINEEKKEINLNNIENPNKFNLFGIKVESGLKNLSEAMGNKEISKITNKQKAQEILKQFFEGMGYEVIA